MIEKKSESVYDDVPFASIDLVLASLKQEPPAAQFLVEHNRNVGPLFGHSDFFRVSPTE